MPAEAVPVEEAAAEPERLGIELEHLGGQRWRVIREHPPGGDPDDPEARQDRRDWNRANRDKLRRGMRAVLTARRVTGCGKAIGATPDGSVTILYSDARGTSAEAGTGANGTAVGVAGLFACGNVWLCPVCAAKVAARRAAKLERALRAAVDGGGWAVLITFTLRHHAGLPLKSLVTGLRKGWRAVRSGRASQAEREIYGVTGIVRSIEVTQGVNGWHPHVHALVVFRDRPSQAAMQELAEAMFTRWSTAIVAAGLPAPVAEQHGLDVSHLGAGLGEGTYASLAAWSRYAVKGLTGETVLGVVKSAKGSSRSVLELMRDAVLPAPYVADDGRQVATVDDTARELLREYETATKGLKHLTGLAPLEKALGLDVDEATDEEIAAEELDDPDAEPVAVIAAGYWDDHAETLRPDLAAAGERGGPDAIRALLDTAGVPWTWPTRPPRTWQDARLERERADLAPGAGDFAALTATRAEQDMG